MEIREYEATLPELGDVMEQARTLARHLRFLAQMAKAIGFSLEELASLDREEK